MRISKLVQQGPACALPCMQLAASLRLQMQGLLLTALGQGQGLKSLTETLRRPCRYRQERTCLLVKCTQGACIHHEHMLLSMASKILQPLRRLAAWV